MSVAVLALQGAFIEHERMLAQLGVATHEVRQLADWRDHIHDALVIPGGESTVQLKLLRELGLLSPITEAIAAGMPVLGTCAGLILLSNDVVGEPAQRINTMDITVERNGYGRQLGSFHATAHVKGAGADIPMSFIRAPKILSLNAPDCEPLAVVDGVVVAARQRNQLALAFHPELDGDLRMHQLFLDMI